MLKKGYILLLLISCANSFSQIDDFLNFKKDKIVIPFKLSNNLIIVNVELNSTKLNMILDTGSSDNILFSVPNDKELIINNPSQTSVIGLGTNESVSAIISTNNILKIKDYHDKNFRILILDENEIDLISKMGIEINGILGYSFFKENIIEINYIKRKITIYKNDSILQKRRIKKYTKKSFDLHDNKPYVNINSSISDTKEDMKLLVDLGLSDGLWIFENDSTKIPDKNIDDYLGFGLSGEIKGKRARVKRINLSDFYFSDVLVAYPDSVFYNNIKIINDRKGSLGGEILKRFHLIINYKEKNIFFKKNNFFSNEFNYNMSGIEIQHGEKNWVKEEIRLNSTNERSVGNTITVDETSANYKIKFILKPIFVISSIRVKSPASLVNLKVGDKIISINNRNAYSYTIQKITDLFQSDDGKKIKMEVERDGEIIKVEFKLKKII